jgi:Leucine-rich repeat (LRR) protein
MNLQDYFIYSTASSEANSDQLISNINEFMKELDLYSNTAADVKFYSLSKGHQNINLNSKLIQQLFVSKSFFETNLVFSIRLDFNLLQEIPVNLLSMHLNQLVHLNIAHNSIRVIPHEICQLKELKDLDMAFNLIEELPQCISYATKIKKRLGNYPI